MEAQFSTIDNETHHERIYPSPEPAEPVIENKGPIKFLDRFDEMGLTQQPVGVFSYEDKFGGVQYKRLQTVQEEKVPLLGIYTKPNGSNENIFIGTVSDSYQFVGHDSVNQKIREMISEVGIPVFTENPKLSDNISEMINEIVIKNAKAVSATGDVYPQLVVTNSYNGHRAVLITFGFSIENGRWRNGSSFRNKLGHIRQVHLLSAKSRLISAVSQFIQVFNENIIKTIELNFNTKIDEQDFWYVLDMLEQLGKKKREAISSYIADTLGTQINNWNLFNVICKFSTSEKHFNTRALLENIAEKVLILPVEFCHLMQTITQR